MLLFAFAGAGTLDGDTCPNGSAALLLEGEQAELSAGADGLAAVRVTIGGDVDLHAPMGTRERIVSIDHGRAGQGDRQPLVPGSVRPSQRLDARNDVRRLHPAGRAPWHYHLYDEIVWVWRGPGRYHVGAAVEELPDGAAFRITPREVHIVENLSDDREMAVSASSRRAGALRPPT